ncbi:MAG TPA: hypothetical protein PLL90_01275 [Bacteroidales bacterium]|nr:hypothetical protein [Bacteroidales bacterium]
MFTRIFKYHTNFQIVFILLSALALWLPAFIKSVAMLDVFDLSFGYNILYLKIYSTPWLYTGLAFVLLLAEALVLNTMLSEFKIAPKNSFLPAFLYILLMSSSPNLLTLHPFIIVNAFIITILMLLFEIKNKDSGYREIFLCGILTGLASLFYFKAAGLLIIVWIFILLYRPFTWREWFISLLGVATVYIYLFAYFFLTDQLLAVFHEYRRVFSGMSFGGNFGTVSVFQYITFALIVVLFLVSSVKMFVLSHEKVILVRKAFYAIFWLLAVNALSVLFLEKNLTYEFSYTLLPLSVLVAYYYLNLKKILFGEIILGLFIVSIILQKIFLG